MEHSRGRKAQAARIPKADAGGAGGGDDRSSTASKGADLADNEAIIRGAEQRLEIERMKGREQELKRQLAVLSEACAELAGEVAKGNLLLASRDARITEMQDRLDRNNVDPAD